MNQYYFAFVPKGAVAEYCAGLTEELTQKCQLAKKRSPPHITIIPPFKMGGPHESVDEILDFMQANLAVVKLFRVTLRHWGWFTENPSDQTLYLGVQAEQRLDTFAHDMAEYLSVFSNGAVKPLTRFTPHISIARHLTP